MTKRDDISHNKNNMRSNNPLYTYCVLYIYCQLQFWF